MKGSLILEQAHQAGSTPASASAGAASVYGDSPRLLEQGEHVAHLRSGEAGEVAQLKGRVAWNEIKDEEKREALKKEVEAAREARIAAKEKARKAWLKDGGQDDEYNAAMEKARGDYGRALLDIKQRAGLSEDQFVTGRDYYGTEKDGIFTQPDTGKQYVQDANGVFIRRYARRELNKFDLPRLEAGEGLAPTGHSVHGKGKVPVVVSDSDGDTDTATARPKKKPKARSFGDKARQDTPLSVKDREFLQQSLGGGENQFAFSHTSTGYPILSNDHKNFGKPGVNDKQSDPHGRIVTDLSKIPREDRFAQWTLADEAQGGHKIRREASSFPEAWMHKRRDKVTTSGYRNMEVVTSTVPQASVAELQYGWEEDDRSGRGLSPAGEWYKELTARLEKPTEVDEEKKGKEKTEDI
jgi:hypothetical protein